MATCVECGLETGYKTYSINHGKCSKCYLNPPTYNFDKPKLVKSQEYRIAARVLNDMVDTLPYGDQQTILDLIKRLEYEANS